MCITNKDIAVPTTEAPSSPNLSSNSQINSNDDYFKTLRLLSSNRLEALALYDNSDNQILRASHHFLDLPKPFLIPELNSFTEGLAFKAGINHLLESEHIKLVDFSANLKEGRLVIIGSQVCLSGRVCLVNASWELSDPGYPNVDLEFAFLGRPDLSIAGLTPNQ